MHMYMEYGQTDQINSITVFADNDMRDRNKTAVVVDMQNNMFMFYVTCSSEWVMTQL